MSWDVKPDISLGKKKWFNPYSDWEAKVRPDFVDPTLPNGSKATELWHPVYAMINANVLPAGDPFDDLVKAIIAMNGRDTVVPRDSEAILKELDGKRPNEVSEIAHRFILYRSASTAEIEPPSANPQEPLYHIIRIGPAIPRTLLSLEGPGFANPPVAKNKAERPVLAGVIDDYIGVAHERFRQTKTSTRIMHYWKQGVETFKSAGPIQGISLGREFSKSELDNLLDEGISEEQFYKKLNNIVRGESIGVGVTDFFSQLGRLYGLARDETDDATRQTLIVQLEELLESPQGQDVFVFLDGFLNGNPGSAILDSFREVVKDLKDKKTGIQLSSLFGPFSDAFKLFDNAFTRQFGDSAAHGTAVMDLVAGRNLKEDHDTVVTDPIVAVELPSLATLETNGARLEIYILQAVHRLFYWADRYPQEGGNVRVPLVINLSYGFSAGPKNGNGFLEAELAKLVAERDDHVATYLVMPSGNSYRDQLSASATIKPEDEKTVEWNLPADDHSASFAEIRLDRLTDFKFTLATPDDISSEVKEVTPGKLAAHNLNNKVAIYAHEDPAKLGTALITVALGPTFSVEKPFHRTLPGAYKLKVENTHASDNLSTKIDAQRDDTPSGFASFGRQGYLTDDCVDGLDPVTKNYQLPLPASPECPEGSMIDRDSTLSALATSDKHQILVVGGAYEDDHRPGVEDPESRQPTLYTSSGKNLTAKPDLSAITETGRVLQGIMAAGPYSGTCRTISGTSVAAPQVSRKLIEYLNAKPTIRPANARAFASKLLEGTLPQDPDPRLGYPRPRNRDSRQDHSRVQRRRTHLLL